VGKEAVVAFFVVVSLLFVYVFSRRCCLDVLVMVYLVVKWGV
jgi:hypothetical protein